MTTKVQSPDIILYGGGFDPPHQGHLDCVRSAKKLFPDAKVVVLPAFAPVHAGGEPKAMRMAFETRLELCELAFIVDAGIPDVVVADDEALLPKPNFTVNLVEHFQKNNKNARISLLVGLDQWRAFSGWHEPVGILSMCDLIIAKRDNESVASCIAEVIEHRLGLNVFWVVPDAVAEIKGAASNKRGCYLHIIRDDTTRVSSSQIRELFDRREPVPHGWLTPSVEQKLRCLNYIA